jgi:hypothetical protein
VSVLAVTADVGGFSLRHLGRALGLVDLALVAGAALYLVAAVRSWTAAGDDRAVANDTAPSAVGGLIGVAATAASVLMAATGVVLGLGAGSTPISAQASSQLTLTAVWLVLSLIAGTLSASYVLTHIHHRESVAENPYVVGCATAQLVALVGGGVFFTVSLFLL